MELLIPVVLKMFPNALPSTFEDKFAAVCILRETVNRVRDAAVRGEDTVEGEQGDTRHVKGFGGGTEVGAEKWRHTTSMES